MSFRVPYMLSRELAIELVAILSLGINVSLIPFWVMEISSGSRGMKLFQERMSPDLLFDRSAYRLSQHLLLN